MTVALILTLAGLGFAGAFVTGLLGIGGAIVMIPLLLYVPPWLGVGALEMRDVAGVTMTQVFVAAVAGMLAHRRYGLLNADLVWAGGVAMAAGSLAGAIGSGYVDEKWLLLTFAVMATSAVVLMLIPVEEVALGLPDSAGFSSRRTAMVATIVGVAAGLVGAGGAFLLVPLLIVVVGVPLRTTIASSLGITAMAATTGFFGKLATGQVPLVAALAATAGAIPGAQFGATISHRLTGTFLKRVLAALIALAAGRVWWDFLAR